MKNNKTINNDLFIKETGYLKEGIHPFTLKELKSDPILGGTSKRLYLINNLKFACEYYWQYDIDNILIDGSFATVIPNVIQISDKFLKQVELSAFQYQ